MNCWKCRRRIDENYPEWAGDGMCYPTFPPQYAHAVCPPESAVEPRPPTPLTAIHCRTCNLILFGRNDGLRDRGHNIPSPASTDVHMPCPDPDFGPEVVVCEVPW